jgi:hypothetical protein
VPPEVIVGIIGVETIYGRYMGNFRVLDALTTLTFDYPDTPNRDSRQATFRKNLEDFLVWTRDSQLDPTTVLGSYTGAIGIPQFLPSSIREYAVDYDGGGHVDLRSSPADAIGSVANYLKQHGWETDRPVVWRITPDTGPRHRASRRRRSARTALGAVAVAARRHDAQRADRQHHDRSRYAGHRGRPAVAGTRDRVHARAEELLRADALQPQLLLRAQLGEAVKAQMEASGARRCRPPTRTRLRNKQRSQKKRRSMRRFFHRLDGVRPWAAITQETRRSTGNGRRGRRR